VNAQTLTFTPEKEEAATTGEPVGPGGQISAGADGGVIVPSQPLTPAPAPDGAPAKAPADAGTPAQ
jgi:hypothetical protein